MSKKNSILPNWEKIAKILKYREKDFENLLKQYVSHKKVAYNQVKAIPKSERNFENTVLALENSDGGMANTFFQIGAYAMTHKSEDFRNLATDFQKKSAQASVDLEYDKDIFRAICEYREGKFKEEKKTLDKKYGQGSLKLFEDTYKGYLRMGFALPQKKQEKLKEILKKINNLSLDFSKNISDYTDFILLEKSQLAGLPENFITTLEKEGEKYKVTLDYPSFGPFLQYAENRAKRKEISDKDYKKGGEANLKILAEIVKLRMEKAKILGYKNYLDFNLEERMVKNGANVEKFVNGLIKRVEKKAQSDMGHLRDFAKKNLPQYKEIEKIEYYDVSYLANKLKENKYGYDNSKIKEYFSLDPVLKAIFQIFGELFSFTVKEITDPKMRKILVDKDVKIFEFKDKVSKEILSYLILDLFPRKGKFNHACSTEFIISEYLRDKRVVPINNIICNFTKPSKNTPSLLTLGEVEVLFHELGHSLHYMFTKATYFSQAGYNTVFDFIETPSQMLENFLFEEENLKKLAKHYQTRKTLVPEIIKKIIAGKNFLIAYSNFRQLILNLLDIGIHSGRIKPENSAKYFKQLLKGYLNFNLEKEAVFPAGFGHMIGYAAGYYSYLWALVYADDFYSVFRQAKNKKELLEIGARYRREILEVGGSREESVSVKKFLKRNSNNKAFLKNLLEG